MVNCKTGEADKSMSFWLLLFWLLSDSANFVGTILTNQLITLVGNYLYRELGDAISPKNRYCV